MILHELRKELELEDKQAREDKERKVTWASTQPSTFCGITAK